jgi:hypothetical protein
MQELIDVLMQQSDAFNAEFVRYFYEDPSDREVLKGILEPGLAASTALSRHQDRYARHPVTSVVRHPNPSANKPEFSYTRRLPSADAPIGSFEDIPGAASIANVLQRPSSDAKPVANSFDALTREGAVDMLARGIPVPPSSSSSGLAGPSTAPGHTLVGPAVPPSTSAEMEGVENAGL